MSRTSRPLLLALALLVGGCASTPEEPVSRDEDLSLPGDRARARAGVEVQAIGMFLREINARIRAWTQLTMTARTAEQRLRVSLLEQDLTLRTNERRDEIIHELESGPRANRIIAASALGFTHASEAHSPLLAALEDPDVEIQNNALLGLTLLGRADTPLERVCELLSGGGDGWVRSNAASCASTLVNAGARSDCLLDAARGGLSDVEPGVRSQCALILATLVDTESMDRLAGLLHDEIPLVRAAAVRAIAHIGSESPPHKAAAARELVQVYTQSSGTFRSQVQEALMNLSGRAYGADEKEWVEWARRLQ
jgi:HEAT repeat protein